jgi:hypothetical protein
VNQAEKTLRQQYVDALNGYVAREEQLKEFALGFVAHVSPGQPLPRVIVTNGDMDKWERLQAERDVAFGRHREAERRYLEHLHRMKGGLHWEA